jgi:hypothetical protein
MKIGTEDKKKLTIAAVVGTIGLGCIFYIYSELSVPSAPKPTAAPVPTVTTTPVASASVASKTKAATGNVVGSQTAALQLDPTLRMGPMLVTEALVYSGTGRNIFSQTSVQVEIPKAVAPARPKGPVAPVYVAPAGPPPPPPIDLKFFGTATSKDGSRQVFLLHGEDVFLASAGDIVQRRYKVISVTANSVMVEDMTNSNRQTLPLLK